MSTTIPTAARPRQSALIALATARGGHCLSNDLTIRRQTKYLWKCGDCDREWEATWENVKHNNSWCPGCRVSIREIVCRAAMCEIFPGETFETDRTAIGMELDGYSPRLKLAFEHDGVHHSERVPHFQRTEAEFAAQQERDARKDKLCAERGIRLIRVPGRTQLAVRAIRAYVHEAATTVATSEERAQIPAGFVCDRVFMDSVQISRRRTDYMPDARARVEARGGELISKKCVAYRWPLHVQCEDGHEFETNYENLRRGRWCPECGLGNPVTEVRVSALLAERGCMLVDLRETEEPATRRTSKGDANAFTRRRWVVDYICASGHEVDGQDWDNINAGKGCRTCAPNARVADDDARARALGYGIDIVGPYKNLNAPVLMKCKAAGHEFTSTLAATKRRHDNEIGKDAVSRACPVCASARNFAPMRLDQPWPVDADLVRTLLAWRCDKCDTREQVTYNAMARRTKFPCKCAK